MADAAAGQQSGQGKGVYRQENEGDFNTATVSYEVRCLVGWPRTGCRMWGMGGVRAGQAPELCVYALHDMPQGAWRVTPCRQDSQAMVGESESCVPAWALMCKHRGWSHSDSITRKLTQDHNGVDRTTCVR